MTVIETSGVSVVLSSHVLAELERVADHLILLSRGQVQIAGEVDGLLAAHRLLTGPAADGHAGWPVVHASRAEAQARLLVRASAADPVPPGRRTRWAWKNSPWPTCASPAPRRCPARPAAGAPSQRR